MLRLLAMVLLAVVLLGCGDPLRATVTGTILLDGVPLPLAGVQFWPKEDVSLGVYSGKTDAQGRFELQSRTEKYIKAGTYIAVIAKDVKTKDGKPPDASDDMMFLAQPGALKNILPAKYFDRANPIFIVEVKPGANDLAPFALVSP